MMFGGLSKSFARSFGGKSIAEQDQNTAEQTIAKTYSFTASQLQQLIQPILSQSLLLKILRRLRKTLWQEV